MHFWRSPSYYDIDSEIEEFNEMDSSWAAKVAAATSLMQRELKVLTAARCMPIAL